MAWLLDLIATGTLRVAPLVLYTLPPDEAQQADDGYVTQPDTYLGTVLDWTGEPEG